MSSNYGVIKGYLEKMENLYNFFSHDSAFTSSSLDLPSPLDFTRQEAFRNKLKENMTKLRTSIFGQEDVDKRDEFGTNPMLAGERKRYIEDSSSVLTYCQTELFPLVRDLYNYLLTQKSADLPTDILSRLREILPEEPTGTVITRRGGEEASLRPSPGRESEVYNLQRPSREGTSVDLISVGRDLLEKIRKHQSKLDAYVNGYIRSREQWVACNEAHIKLDDGKKKRQDVSSADYWNVIKSHLVKVKMTEIVPRSLADEFEEDDIFKEALGKVFEEVEKIAKSPDSFSRLDIDRSIDSALGEMDKAIAAADLIAKQCRESARIILGKIDELIDEIFKHNEDRAKRGADAIETPTTLAPSHSLQTKSMPAEGHREPPPTAQSRQMPS